RLLLDKYNVPAPRYTSYPTVPYWQETPSEEQWLAALAENLSTSQSLRQGAALYLHIPFCEKLCTFCGCNTRITRNHDVARRYIDVVLAEWRLYKEKLGFQTLPFGEMHLGG